jgi:hypothetical protein
MQAYGSGLLTPLERPAKRNQEALVVNNGRIRIISEKIITLLQNGIVPCRGAE